MSKQTERHTFLFSLASCIYRKQFSTLLIALWRCTCCEIYEPCRLARTFRTNTGETARAAISCVCVHRDVHKSGCATEAHDGFSTSFCLLLPLTPTVRHTTRGGSAEDEKAEQRHACATEEQEPRGQIEVENGMKDLPSSDPRQQRPSEGLLHLHSA